MANASKGPRKIDVDLPKRGKTSIYANKRVSDALEEVAEDYTVYKSVRLAQVIEAAYEQGLKDGTHQILDKVAETAKSLEKERPKRIGRPKKK